MKTRLFLIPALLFSLFLIACEGDYRPGSIGGHSEIIVVMDSSMVGSETADALRNTLGFPILTMPRPEPRFDLIFRDLRTNQDLETIQRHKNVVVVSPIDDDTNVGTFMRSLLSENVRQSVREGRSFKYTQHDVWSRDQFLMILSAPSDEELAERILRNERELVSQLHGVELERWKRYVYRRAEQVDLSKEILADHGWTFRIQHDYRVGIDTLNFLSLRRYLADNDRWIWVWWEDDVDFDEIDRDWITEKREKLNREYIRGGSDDKFVRTEFREPYEQRFMTINDMQAYESRGQWTMENDLMGGPFVNYTMYDAENRRLYMMEYGQFAPRWDQRRFIYQFEAMARTFISDPEAKISSDDT